MEELRLIVCFNVFDLGIDDIDFDKADGDGIGHHGHQTDANGHQLLFAFLSLLEIAASVQEAFDGRPEAFGFASWSGCGGGVELTLSALQV